MISYDLGDCTKWEFMFPGLDKPILQIPEADDDLLLDDDDEVMLLLFPQSLFVCCSVGSTCR